MIRTMPQMLSAHICLAAVASIAASFPVFGGDRAPPSPDKPWYPPQLREYEKKLAHREVGESPSGTPIAHTSDKRPETDNQEVCQWKPFTNGRTTGDSRQSV